MKLLVCSTILGLAATSAHAGFTTINSPHPGERSHERILETVYGGDFTKSGNDYTNGAITVTRLDDSMDKTFGSGWTLDPVAHYAALDSTLTQNANGSFRLNVENGKSYNSDAVGGTDHFVTYALSGLAGVNNALLIFAEDMPHFDFDYNDLVVQATGGTLNPPAIAVPLPIAAWTGLAGLGFAGLVLKRRRRA
jgi:hypothetical protein